MKLLRYGPLGAEKPGLLDDAGLLRDLSDHVVRISRAPFWGTRIWTGCGALTRRACPSWKGSRGLVPVWAGIGKFLCIGLNYSDHAAETGATIPEHPILFFKANSAVVGPNDDVMMPRGSTHTDWECELGVVIGKEAKYVSVEDALDHVAGYCIVNDVSERQFPE